MKKTLAFLFTITLVFSCSFFEDQDSKAQLIEKDRANLNEAVSTNVAMLYKFIKVSLKFSYAEENDVKTIYEEHPEVKAMYEGAGELIRILNKSKDNEGNIKELSVLDYINIYRNFRKAKKATTAFNEDLLPSFFELTSSQKRQFTEAELKELKVADHITFAVLSLLLKGSGLPMCYYELSKLEPDALPDVDYKINIVTARNIMLYMKGLYYLSEYELTDNINWMNANPHVDFKGLYDIPNHLKSTLGGKERAIMLIHNHLIRGLDRLKMDSEISEKEALEDFEAVITISEEADIDNEIIQAVKIYFYLKNENPEKAIATLQKLKTSKILSNKEKQSIDQAISYLEKRESGKVLNGVYDKAFLSKIVISYIYAQAKEVDWEKGLKDNGFEVPKEAKQTIKTIEDIMQKVDKYSNQETLDKAKESVKDKSLDLWNKAKESLND